MRASGILLHISSLPSPYGIGTLGAAAYEFVDFLSAAGQQYWQILPVGPTSYGDSPYQSFSTFAGNPYFIDFEILQKDGLLQKSEYDELDWGEDPRRVDYGKLYQLRFSVLRKAYVRGIQKNGEEFEKFRWQQRQWLDDYALFMALKDFFGGRPWQEWDEDIRLRKPHAMQAYRIRLLQEIDFWAYLQFEFYRQWSALQAYAHENKVQIIGDLPIYVAMDSADVWSNPDLFWLDETLCPKFVAGVPPDYFSKDGQLWGNPLYVWSAHQRSGYQWWIERVRAATTIFDKVRIDHFRAFSTFYAVPFGEKTARNGHWEKGPGMAFFDAVSDALGELDIIAEDLGDLSEDVHKLLEESGFPGMKILQFSIGDDWNNGYLPHNHVKNCVVYTGTHDNDTVMGWWRAAITPEDRRHAVEYFRLSRKEGIAWGFVRAAWSSVADLAIAPIQDILGLENEARMNLPSTETGNWQFRVAKEALTLVLANQIRKLTVLYHRQLPEPEPQENLEEMEEAAKGQDIVASKL